MRAAELQLRLVIFMAWNVRGINEPVNKLEKARASCMIAAFLSENSQHIIDHATEFYITFYTTKYQQKPILTSSLVNWVFPWQMKTE